jgi:toxin HigB-1
MSIAMIRSFRDRRTGQVFAGRAPKGFPSDLIGVARRKLRMIDAAEELEDLRAPPGNRLEGLLHDLRGRHSIRINDQFRVCFVWRDGDAFEVEIVDYH